MHHIEQLSYANKTHLLDRQKMVLMVNHCFTRSGTQLQ